jgi:hypothetical protein
MIKQNRRTWYLKKKPHAVLREVHGIPTAVVKRVVDAGGLVNRCSTIFQIPAGNMWKSKQLTQKSINHSHF